MGSSRLAFAAVATACVVAAGTGSYVATRQNVAGLTAPAASAASAPPPEAASSAPASASTPAATPPTPTASPKRSAVANESRRPAQRPDPRVRTTRAIEPQRPLVEAQNSGAPALAPASPLLEPLDALPSILPTDSTPLEPARTPQPVSKRVEEFVVASDSVIGLQTEGLITSERARVEDQVEARVSRDVRVNGAVAIPAGTRALGNVVAVDRGGRVRERARLGIRFHTLQLADGTRLPISTETIYRFGDAPSNGSAAKIGGGAVAGAILGAIIGGGKGAAIGVTTGAGAGTAAVMSGERSAAVFPPGADVTARILSPVTVTLERE